MKSAIQAALRPMRSRQHLLLALRLAALGLAVSAGIGLIVGVVRLVFGIEVALPARVSLLAAGPAIGLLIGLFARRSWHSAAAAVDGHYALKDRTVTALAFANEPSPSDLAQLQFSDAMDHLGTVEPGTVAPLRAPRGWPVFLTATIAAAAFLLWPIARPEAEAGPAPTPENVLAVAQDQKAKLAKLEKKLAEMAQDMEDEKGNEEKKGLKELLEKLLQKVEELSQPGIDEKEALVKLSEMQTEVQTMVNQLNIAALDGQLSSLGGALATSSPFEGAGKALMDAKFEKAAKELEKLDEVKMTPKEAKALEEKLKQLAKQMGEAGQGSLSDTVGELADGLKGGKGKVGKATRTLAKKVYNAAKRRKVNDLLLAQIEEYKEGRCNCQANGGPRLRMPVKSMDPSSTWGRGIAGDIRGDKTKLPSNRNQQQIFGTPSGEGDSEMETTATPEARQQASRAYQQRYTKFKQESDAVLEGEPIPLGHRQTVKRYFELIRPSNADAPAAK
jgi:hypothetical protein